MFAQKFSIFCFQKLTTKYCSFTSIHYITHVPLLNTWYGYQMLMPDMDSLSARCCWYHASNAMQFTKWESSEGMGWFECVFD